MQQTHVVLFGGNRLSPVFRAETSCSVGQEDAFFFKMAKNEIMQTTFPHIFSSFKNEDISVAHFCSTQDRDDLFH
jgi:hypothetical protein